MKAIKLRRSDLSEIITTPEANKKAPVGKPEASENY